MTRVLLVSGLGPLIKSDNYLEGTLFAPDAQARSFYDEVAPGFDLDGLMYRDGSQYQPLLLPRATEVPHLTTFTLRAILNAAGIDHDHLDTRQIWMEEYPSDLNATYDVIMLSTTFIYEWRSLTRAVNFLSEHYPAATLVLGGQFTNLKFAQATATFQAIDYIIRGDGEQSIPLLLEFLLHGRGDPATMPNLVTRTDAGRLAMNPTAYVDIEAWPSPGFSARHEVVPYESMRGCPFDCAFCSYPSASPKWRFKSATKIRDDWARYAEECGTNFIKAMDSTFTVPPTRMRELFDLLPSLGVEWEGYSRANTLKDAEYLERLVESHCRSLSIGFESMSDATLKRMSKRVTVAQNLRALELIADSPMEHRGSFIAGFPGETEDDFALTREYLASDYHGRFVMSVFSMQDETMPVWQRAAEFGLEVDDVNDPDSGWRHDGMTSNRAWQLHHEALDKIRRSNEKAVLVLWQSRYEIPIMLHRSDADRMRLEKVIERIGWLVKDQPDRRAARVAMDGLSGELRDLDVKMKGDVR